MQNEEDYIDLVEEIILGYSEIEYDDHKLFIRHHNLRDQATLIRKIKIAENELVGSGVLREQEAVVSAIKTGEWTQQQEDHFRKIEKEIPILENAIGNIQIPSRKRQQQTIIEEKKQELFDLKKERIEAIGPTVENLAEIRANGDFIADAIYVDKELTEKLENSQIFDIRKYREVIKLHNNIYGKFSDDNISRAVLMDFFSPLMGFSDNSMSFYGKPITLLSFFQLKLIYYAKVFHNILTNCHDLPQSLRKEPKSIIDWVNNKEKREKIKGSKTQKDTGATAIFGEKQDVEEMRSAGERVVSLKKETEKHGGSMNMKQLMDLIGCEEIKK